MKTLQKLSVIIVVSIILSFIFLLRIKTISGDNMSPQNLYMTTLRNYKDLGIKFRIFTDRKLPMLPYIDGWNVNTSKNFRDYIDENLTPHILPKKFCNESGKNLVVIVTTQFDSFRTRQIIRNTWGKKGSGFSLYFLIGEDESRNVLLNDTLYIEVQRYNDIVQERFIDTYNNLTLKSISMLKLFNKYCAQSYTYLLKIDDDVYFFPENLLRMLRNRNSDKNLLAGRVFTKALPIRNPESKWYTPYELYPKKIYPDYIQGPAYLMSKDVAKTLYECSQRNSIFFIEDVFITGICAQKSNIVPQDDRKFQCCLHLMRNKSICALRNFYTIHSYSPRNMLHSYRLLEEKGCPID